MIDKMAGRPVFSVCSVVDSIHSELPSEQPF